jgi:AcrR family transcriptional regulator
MLSVTTTRDRIGKGRRETPRKGDLREQAILDTAERLLGEVGVDAMTVEDIARGAGLSRASLYFYYGSKQEVLTALLARTMTTLLDNMTIVVDDPSATPEQIIRRAMKDTEQLWREHGHIMRAAVELAPNVPDIERLWTSTLNGSITSLIKVMVRAGLPDTKAAGGAAAVTQALGWATERNFYHASLQPDQPRALRRATAVLTEIWLRVLPTPRA